jgi:hypothetical protein
MVLYIITIIIKFSFCHVNGVHYELDIIKNKACTIIQCIDIFSGQQVEANEANAKLIDVFSGYIQTDKK